MAALLCPGCTQRDQRIAQLEKINAQLQAEVERLKAQLEAAERAGKRQAAPFSQGPPLEDPKTPGRKSGERHGRHGHRQPPPPDQIDEVLEAPLPEHCGDCGGKIVEDEVKPQYQTEIPRKPLNRQINVHIGHCQDCGKHAQGHHPLQTSDALGAAAAQLGPDAQAAVVYLNKDAGLTHGKIARTFQDLFGIQLSRGASAQIVLRGGRRLQPAYQEIRQHLREAQHITPDESGWRIGGQPVWIHSWVGDDGATCYVIDPQRSADRLQQLIGIGWSGTMTHDGSATYDRFEDATHQKCIDHALRRARKLVETQAGAAQRFPTQVIGLFTSALETRDQLRAGTIDQDQATQAFEDYTADLEQLTSRSRHNEENERFAKHLNEGGCQWFTFLLDPSVPATNHRAEQALKTPIINRKVSGGGNRTDPGARAQEPTSSVLQTCKNRAQNAIQFISQAFCGFVGSLFGPTQPTPSASTAKDTCR
jgi:transposase